ncbi:MAG: cobalamin biosynthesis protein [Oscillospiraceae bacterium]
MIFEFEKFLESNNLVDTSGELSAKFTCNINAKIRVKSDFDIQSPLPDFIEIVDDNYDFYITYKNIDSNFCLVPKVLTLGIGCRKNKLFSDIENYFAILMKENNISPLSFNKICSIDLKKDEEGIIFLAKKYNIPFITYSSNELQKAEGEYKKSDFVKSITGVDNVCERSAKLGCDGKIILHKTAFDGITIAVGLSNYTVNFNL